MDKKIQFQNLIECSSLDKKIKMHLDKIAEEEKRIAFIEGQKHKKLEQLNSVTSDLEDLQSKNSGIEKELHQLYQNIEKSKEHLTMAQNQKQADSIQNELNTLQEKIDNFENEGLELLERTEELENQKKEVTDFLGNIDQTISDLKGEVSSLTAEETRQIKQYESRIETLLKEVDSSFKDAYNLTLKSFRFKAPITFIMGKKCRECHFEVDEYTRDNVDRNFQIEHCPGCNRLIVPISATNA